MAWRLMCNELLIIRKQASKVLVLYCTTQLLHEIPTLSLLTQGSNKAQTEFLA